MENKNIRAVIVAAGSSSRMKSEKSKVLLKIGSISVIERTISVFANIDEINKIIIVARKEDFEEIKCAAKKFIKPIEITEGGKDRQSSVYNGVTCAGNCDYIVVHDGARPLVTEEEILNVIADGIKYGSATLSVVPKDTVKTADENGYVLDTPPRESLRNITTPQVFERNLYLSALEKAKKEFKSFTDDCQLIENYGKKVYLTEGKYTNIKITTPEDIKTAGALVGEERVMRIGHGYDVHKLCEGRDLIIGGVNIPHNLGLLGHSDADVLLHAISDSLLGAAALGDIGKHFPDTDPSYKGADSLELLKQVAILIKKQGYRIVNIDATVIAQKPKLAPYIEKMRENIAIACNINASFVSVKATTEEKLGFTGKEEGISANSVCLICEL